MATAVTLTAPPRPPDTATSPEHGFRKIVELLRLPAKHRDSINQTRARRTFPTRAFGTCRGSRGELASGMAPAGRFSPLGPVGIDAPRFCDQTQKLLPQARAFNLIVIIAFAFETHDNISDATTLAGAG
jgi:hypothetical protein